MFGLPQGRGTREWVALVLMIAVVLAIFGHWAFRRADRAIDKAAQAVPDAAEDEPPADPSVVEREAVLARRERERSRGAAIRDEGEEGPAAGIAPGEAEPWQERPPELVAPEDAEWLVRTGREEEAAKASFLPMLDEFRPVEPDAVRAFRQRLLEKVEAGERPTFALPSEEGATGTLERISARGVAVRRQDGTVRRLGWEDIPPESFYGLARTVAEIEGPEARALDALYLAGLADLAGSTADAQLYRRKAVELDPSLEEAAGPPKVSLNYLIMDEFSWAWDDPLNPTPKAAHNLRDDGPAIFHVYRYVRTLGEEGLNKVALRNPPYGRLLARPAEHRGRVFRIVGRFLKRYKSMRWTRDPRHVEAGIRDLDFFFVIDANMRGIYLISVPRDTRPFTSSDIVAVTGVYMRRWPYPRGGSWMWRPWIAAADLEEVEVEAGAGIGAVGYFIFAAGIVGVVVVYFAARRESKEGTDSRDRRLARLRGSRDHIRQKVAEASRAEVDKSSEGGPAAGPAGESEKKG